MPTQAEKRRLRFEAAQAALPEESRLATRIDLEQASRRQLSVVTTASYESSKRWFREFVEYQYPELDFEGFYKPSGPVPPLIILKKYAVYLAQSRVGRINKKILVDTLCHYVKNTLSQIGRERGGTFLSKIDATDLHNFVRFEVPKQEQLPTERHVKAVAHTSDMTFLLSVLHSPDHLGIFTEMRTILNVTLYMNLVVDSCGRGGDIAQNPNQKPGTHLKWSDVAFYAFPLGDGVEITANVTFRWMKGMSDNDSLFKVIPYRLLSTSLANQDTLRLLLFCAIMDKVIDGVHSWADLMRFRPSATGTRIGIRPMMAELPVLRQVRKHQVTQFPATSHEMQTRVRRLGQFAGLEHRTTGYCLRRGAAYILDRETTEENRKFLMGHRTNSRAYSAYLSTISTIDFAALYRDLETRPVDALIGMQLNRSDTAPRKLSAQGYEVILASPEYQRLNRTCEQICEQILQRYPTLAEASRTGDPMFQQYKAAEAERRALITSMEKEEYKKEYANHFANTTCPLAPMEIDAADLPGILPLPPPPPPPPARPDSVSTESTDGPRITGGDDNDDDGGADAGLLWSNMNIDPQLLDHETFLLSQSCIAEEMLGEEEDIPPGPTPGLNTTQEDEAHSQGANSGPVATAVLDQVFVAANDDSSMRLHGTSGHFDEYKGSSKSQVKKISPNYGISRSFVGSGIGDPLLKLLTSDMDEEEQCKGAIQVFSTLHPHDAFYAGEEPFPGTYDCRFCGLDLVGKHHPSHHVHSCAKIDAVDSAKRLLDQKYPYQLPCTYQACGFEDTRGQFVTCNHVSATREEFWDHARYHLKGMKKTLKQDKSKVLSCFFGQCATHPENGRLYRGGPEFATVEEQMIHVKTVHAIVPKKAATADFCEFCQEWIVDYDEQANHIHLEQVSSLIKELGYAGVSGSRQLVPRFCIFCFHDPAATPSQRAFTYSREGFCTHLRSHLSNINDERTCPAYPELCSKSTPMTAEEMKLHLEHVHCISISARKGNKKSTASISDQVDASDIPATKKNKKSAVPISDEVDAGDTSHQGNLANSTSSKSSMTKSMDILGGREMGGKRKALEDIPENTTAPRKQNRAD